MADLIRLSGFVLILMATVLTAVYQQPDGASDLDPKVWTVDYWLASEWDCLNERDTPIQLQENLDQKIRALQRLRNGRVTLFEAAAVFNRLRDKELYLTMRLVYPELRDRSDEELACLQVIRWVSNESTESKRLVERLQEELRQHLEQYGKVILPDAKPGN